MTSPLSEAAFALCLASLFLMPLAGMGIALVNTGLGRSRSAAHAMLASLCASALAGVIYVAVGFSIQGFQGRPSFGILLGSASWSLIASDPWFLRGLSATTPTACLGAVWQVFGAGIGALIPVGAGGDRWRLGAICAATALFSAITYPLFGHWANAGWLVQLGSNYHLGRGFLDAGGTASVHVTGGVTALSISWLLGPRRGKYGHDGVPTALPGHNGVLVLLACPLAGVGWFGWNCAGAILYAGADLGRMVWVALDTFLCASAAALIAGALTRFRFSRPDASLCANAWFGGLVASSAVSCLVSPFAALLVGAIAGALVVYSVEWLDLKLAVDDPAGAISVHAIAGVWGLLALGFFGPPEQWLAQLVGVATLLGFIFPLTFGMNWLLDRYYAYRVPPEAERQGLDLHELGAGAYPEFVTHYDEFSQR